jgi:sec-independent protein translocase protein TatC
MAGTFQLPKLKMPSLPGSAGDDEHYVDLFGEMATGRRDELRFRLVKICTWFVLAFIVGLYLASPLLDMVYSIIWGGTLTGLIPAEETNTDFFKTGLNIAIACSLPLIFYEIIAFVSPGLNRQEKCVLYGSLPLVVLSFLLGVLYFPLGLLPFRLGGALASLMPIQFLSDFGSELLVYDIEDVSVGSSFQGNLAMGSAFELIVIMVLLTRQGIISSKRLSFSRRYAVAIVVAVAAIVTPKPFPFNMICVAAAFYLLYKLGIYFAKRADPLKD